MTKVFEDKGFTLLEVLIALAILTLAYGALYPIFGGSPIRIKETINRDYALAIAQARMQDVLARKRWNDLPESGEDMGWAWKVEGENYAHSSDSERAPGFLYQVTVTVSAAENGSDIPIQLKRIVYRDH
ncbi:MAG: prepilin-type N-terminal cleavage/methylation domain-containing protein [Alphaproteobacteria bacterium]|nr:prepilin-type N-terminal cleavage/methylation domain-containing protein [Alphaproteobacteria bacterium]